MMSSDPASRVFHAVIDGQLYIANMRIKNGADNHRYFTIPANLLYEPLCDDFGPMNISSVTGFIELLGEQFRLYPSNRIVLLVEKGARPLTNGIFLLGTYLLLVLKMEPQDIWRKFENLDERFLEKYRDATFAPSDFGLTHLDCWRALKRAVQLGWIECPKVSGLWGLIDVEEYRQYENPLNGDLVEVVPRKFIAFRGPADLGDQIYRDEEGYREFSPSYYTDIFLQLNVKVVVRLNEALYDNEDFESRGIRHYDLHFDDCTSPPKHVAAEFFRIVDSAGDGMVAVHCKAGLGRTGTLIALDLMRSFSFSAKEAIAWLRIMRPGCVIGPQQQYLCAVEAVASRIRNSGGNSKPNSRNSSKSPALASDTHSPSRMSPVGGATFPEKCMSPLLAAGHKSRKSVSPPPANPAGKASAVLAAQVAAGMERRAVSRANAANTSSVTCPPAAGPFDPAVRPAPYQPDSEAAFATAAASRPPPCGGTGDGDDFQVVTCVPAQRGPGAHNAAAANDSDRDSATAAAARGGSAGGRLPSLSPERRKGISAASSGATLVVEEPPPLRLTQPAMAPPPPAPSTPPQDGRGPPSPPASEGAREPPAAAAGPDREESSCGRALRDARLFAANVATAPAAPAAGTGGASPPAAAGGAAADPSCVRARQLKPLPPWTSLPLRAASGRVSPPSADLKSLGAGVDRPGAVGGWPVRVGQGSSSMPPAARLVALPPAQRAAAVASPAADGRDVATGNGPLVPPPLTA